MKTLKTFIIVSILTLGMTTSVFAAWWNPFTWFQKKVVPTQQVKQNTVPINLTKEVASSTNILTKNSNAQVKQAFNLKKFGISFEYPNSILDINIKPN
ncbi:MAG: hypothetical protein KBC41_01485 [Candidatus Pacebacteria bacterium]|nr:hypothetical protein [Candidatus Paceibacterota bacterium]